MLWILAAAPSLPRTFNSRFHTVCVCVCVVSWHVVSVEMELFLHSLEIQRNWWTDACAPLVRSIRGIQTAWLALHTHAVTSLTHTTLCWKPHIAWHSISIHVMLAFSTYSAVYQNPLCFYCTEIFPFSNNKRKKFTVYTSPISCWS